ncbi:glycoside hydrolase family 9 protein [Streptomyces sp. NPDC057199]|uniref:glycoside hydrolase family 9 protein n=1 Tax=Streptomyces sp. NPDC057199 TaxID=3346047 RepID=UPI00364596B0
MPAFRIAGSRETTQASRSPPAWRDTRYTAFAGRQRGWALGANAWGTSFVIGAGEVHPHCPEHQLANLRGSHDGAAGLRPDRTGRQSVAGSR